MKKDDLDKISEIVAKYGYIEWSLVGFTPNGDHEIFSYFTDREILPVFKAILISMVKTLEYYLGNEEPELETAHCRGQC